MKPISADSWDGRVLLALRAGATDASELAERWPISRSTVSNSISRLIARGLVDEIGDRQSKTYRLTPAGRDACPLRNPLAAAGADRPSTTEQPQETTTMSRVPQVTRQQVLDAITETGSDGASVSQLSEKLDCTEAAISYHLTQLNKSNPPCISRIARGRYAAAEFAPAETPPAQEVPATPPGDQETLAGDAWLRGYFNAQDAQRAGPAAIVIDEEDEIEIGFFSDGTLTITSEPAVINLGEGATRKLMRFMGLFERGQE